MKESVQTTSFNSARCTLASSTSVATAVSGPSRCRFGSARPTTAIRLREGGSVDVLKIGQDPQYAPPAPQRLQDFLQKDKDDLEFFRKGWRCENRGEGIAAFAYYRRVVEDVWAKLLGRLLDAVKKLGDTESVALLEKSRGQWRFSQAVQDVPPAIPKRLRIGGANPLLVLHDAFSVGVHSLSDAECLTAAIAGRKLLVELLDGLAEAAKDDSELKTAVADLQNLVSKNRRALTQSAPVARTSASTGSESAKSPAVVEQPRADRAEE